ncbi:MAG: peptidylprolyl isomerase [Campylobacteraceae bacterium]|jgi:peptidylprolyl isomerase|nr:peptidylprolyl isomerase [Campylobacteraceae bacterium]
MKKLVVGVFALLVAVNINAAVVATVDGQEITDEDVNRALRQITGGRALNYESLNSEVKKQLIDQVIEQKLLVKYAIKNGIEKDADYIKTLAQAKNDIALEIWIEKEFDKIKISNEQVKKYYDENSDKFPLKPEELKVSHILVKDKAAAEKIIKELNGVKELPAKFAEAANKYSEDNASKTNGGSLGTITKQTQLIKEFLDAAFALKKGEISKTPVKTQFGYHIIYVADKQLESKYTFDEVKDNIALDLKKVEFQNYLKTQAKALKDKAKIEIK